MAEGGEIDQPGQAALVPGRGLRILAVPEKFADGDVELWLERFALCAAANSWNADAKAKILPTYLKGRAYAVYRRLTAEQKASYDVLATALKETSAWNWRTTSVSEKAVLRAIVT